MMWFLDYVKFLPWFAVRWSRIDARYASEFR